jgi:hypothetical protein
MAERPADQVQIGAAPGGVGRVAVAQRVRPGRHTGELPPLRHRAMDRLPRKVAAAAARREQEGGRLTATAWQRLDQRQGVGRDRHGTRAVSLAEQVHQAGAIRLPHHVAPAKTSQLRHPAAKPVGHFHENEVARRLAITGAVAAFEDQAYFEQTRQAVIASRDALDAALRPLLAAGSITRLTRHDTNPATNLPIPAEHRA